MKTMMLLTLVVLSGCRITPVKRELRTVTEITAINPDQKYLKAHMKDGTVFVLSDWQFSKADSTLFGYGIQLDINRQLLQRRDKANPGGLKFNIHAKCIALIETNDTGRSVAGGLTLVTGVTGTITFLCLTNPKACFGSCPTFYAPAGDTEQLMAEAFSTSVSPALEKNDIDMLYHTVPSRHFELTVTNEALETHNIRYANLLLLERHQDERVFYTTENKFIACHHFQPPVHADPMPEPNLLALFERPDGKEYFSLTDPHDLNTKEEITFVFQDHDAQRKGLIVGKRQTLLTTFLMYQGLSYMGRTAGYWINQVEAGNIKPQNGIFGLLGGIEVFVSNAGVWEKAGEVNETGPIATDFTLIPLPKVQGDTIKVKLRMAKGLWRIDYLAMTSLKHEVVPQIIPPAKAETIRGQEADPLSKLLDDKQYLVTYPGEAYRLSYELPTAACELFLDSKGYYLEWMREEWEKEQSMRKLNFMLKKPAAYLNRAAETYKKLEPTMEQTFWNSRYVHK